MDTITIAVVTILSKYAPDKGVALGKAVGPRALDTAQEMFGMVLERVRKDPRGAVIADEFEADPQTFEKPLAKKVAAVVAADPDVAADLKGRLEAYEKAAQAHAAQTGQHTTAHLEGDGATAQGDRATALGKQAVQARDVGSDVVTGHKRDVRVEGGQVGVIGDGTHVEGGMFLGDVEAGGDIAARDMTKTVNQYQTLDPEAIARAFSTLYEQVAQQPDLAPQDKVDIREELQEVEEELKEKGQGAREGFIRRRLNNIQRMAPDIADTFFTTLANPLLGVKGVIEKITEKMQDDAGPEPEAA
jgi:hypothetical protein